MRSFRCGWILWLIVSIAAASTALASISSVSVTLGGPDEVWYELRYEFGAFGTYNIDAETQQEIISGDATVTETYNWCCAPAEIVQGPEPSAGGESVELRYPFEAAGSSHTISVTYTVTITFEDGGSESKSASASKDVLVPKPWIRLEPDQTNDYLVPRSSRNRITYSTGPGIGGFVAFEYAELIVKDRVGNVVWSYTGNASSAGIHHISWSALATGGVPLTEQMSPYEYVLNAYDLYSHRVYSDRLALRLVKEWNLSIIVRDRSLPPADYESGVNEDTIADADGNPTNMAVTVYNDGWGQNVAKYGVTADTGPSGWDADVLLKDGNDRPLIVYSTPDPALGSPIRYKLVLSQRSQLVQDCSGNEWDMDERTEQRESTGTWEFGITGDGELRDFTEEYE